MDFDNEGQLLYAGELGSWVQGKIDEWRMHYRTKYETKHEEYYRIWRGQWDPSDRVRDTERSKLIAPATSQAVESSTSEVEEACFGSGKWFDIDDDVNDQQRLDIEAVKKNLMEDFKYCKIRQACVEVLCNAAVTGTGIGELLIEDGYYMRPATQPVEGEEGLQAYGVQTELRPFVKLNPVQDKHFLHDPSASCVDDALGVAVEEYVGLHHVQKLQDDGVYLPVDVTANSMVDQELSPDDSALNGYTNQVRVARYYGLVPTEMLKEFDDSVDMDERYTEAVVVVASGGVVLKAMKNPYMMNDRPIITFQWDVIPGKLRGRGVVEKAYNSQKALDAEIRARVDALALTVHPMMAMDATRLPRGFRPEVKPGKVFLTQGNPNEIMAPFKMGEVSQISFTQAAALQEMVQQATGAIDSTGLLSNIDGAKTGAVSMSMAAIIKRHKRTVVNFQEGFLIPLIRKAAWRYMQFDPERYPASDYNFTPVTSLGTIGREAENQQLVGLLQTMGQDSPAYGVLIEAVVQNTSINNKEAIIEQLRKAAQPDPNVVAEQQAMQKRMQEMELQFKQAQTDAIAAQANESNARATKYNTEAEVEPMKVELEMVRAITNDLKDNEEDKSFDYRLRAMQEMRKNAETELKAVKHNDEMRLKVLSQIQKGASAQ